MFTLTAPQASMVFMPRTTLLNAVYQTALLQAEEKYQQNIDSVTEYCKKGNSIVLGSLVTSPDWFTTEFIDNFEKSKTHMQKWYSGNASIVSQLTSIPSHIVGYDKKYQLFSGKIIECSKRVLEVKDPDIRREYIDEMIEALDYLFENVDDYSRQVQICYADLNQFKSTFGQYKTFFQDALSNAAKSTQDDQDEIDKLTKKVKELTKRIDEYNQKVRDLSISTGVLAGVGILAIFSPFAITAPFLFLGALGTGIADIVAACELNGYKASLAMSQSSLTNYGQDLQVLTSMTNSFTDLNQRIDTAAVAIEDIHSRWTDLSGRLSMVSTHLKENKGRVEDDLFQQIITSMTSTAVEWNTAVAYAEQLNLAGMDLSDIGIHEF